MTGPRRQRATPTWAMLLCGAVAQLLPACGQGPQLEQNVGDARAAAGRHLTSVDAAAPPQAFAAMGNTEHALGVEGGAIVLRRDALGQLFVLTPRFVEASNTPRIHLGTLKFVTFAQYGDVIAMVEPALHAVYHTLPTDRLVATFPIERQDVSHVAFRWQDGTNNLFLRDPLAPADLPVLVRHYIDHAEPVLPFKDGVLQSVRADNGTITMQSMGLAEAPQPISPFMALFGEQPAGSMLQSTYHSCVQLSPYSDNVHYTPKPQPSFAPPYYLQVPLGQLHTSETDFYAMTWDGHDEQDPIIYDLSPDVPLEVVDAVKEGVLYWNRALGRTLVAVHTGVPSPLQPQARHVPIRWIPWHRPGGPSIAEAQANPLTAEIVAAEIYLSSSFYEPTTQILAQAMGALGRNPQDSKNCLVPRVAAATLLEALQHGRGKTFVQRAMADNIRSVVAHEVGHTLGLRHNFAASMDDAQMLETALDRQALWQQYLKGDSRGAARASSVMDYLPDTDNILVGAFIKHGVLPYDRWVIQLGYGRDLNHDLQAGGTPSEHLSGARPGPYLFCSDGERLSGVLGCGQFDSTPNPFAGALFEAQLALRHLPMELLLYLVGSSGEPVEEASLRRKLEALRFEVFSLPVTLITHELFNGLRSNVRVLQVERSHGHLRHSAPISYLEASAELRRQWLNEVGGFVGILGALVGPRELNDGSDGQQMVGWLQKSLQQLIATAPLAKTSSGAHALDAESQRLLLTYAAPFAAALEQAVLTDVLQTLTGEIPKSSRPYLQALTGPLSKQDGTRGGIDQALVEEAWHKPLSDLAETIIMAADSDDVSHREKKFQANLPRPTFSLPARQAAVRLLAPEIFHLPDWGDATRERITQKLLRRLLVLVEGEATLQKPGAKTALRTFGLAGYEELLQLHRLPKVQQLLAQDELTLVRLLMTLTATKRLPGDGALAAAGLQ